MINTNKIRDYVINKTTPCRNVGDDDFLFLFFVFFSIYIRCKIE